MKAIWLTYWLTSVTCNLFNRFLAQIIKLHFHPDNTSSHCHSNHLLSCSQKCIHTTESEQQRFVKISKKQKLTITSLTTAELLFFNLNFFLPFKKCCTLITSSTLVGKSWPSCIAGIYIWQCSWSLVVDETAALNMTVVTYPEPPCRCGGRPLFCKTTRQCKRQNLVQDEIVVTQHKRSATTIYITTVLSELHQSPCPHYRRIIS